MGLLRERCGGYLYNRYKIRLQKTGHKEETCKKDARCLRCSEFHGTSKCTSEEKLCINCGGEHKTKSNKYEIIRLKNQIKRNIERETLFSRVKGDPKGDMKIINFRKRLTKYAEKSWRNVSKCL